MTKEVFKAKYIEHNSQLTGEFLTWYRSGIYSDVTIHAGGDSIQAHKLVLAASSPFFNGIFQDPKRATSNLYFTDVPHQSMKALIEYMYCGELVVKHEFIPACLQLADSLKVKGISESYQEEPITEPVPVSQKMLDFISGLMDSSTSEATKNTNESLRSPQGHKKHKKKHRKHKRKRKKSENDNSDEEVEQKRAIPEDSPPLADSGHETIGHSQNESPTLIEEIQNNCQPVRRMSYEIDLFGNADNAAFPVVQQVPRLESPSPSIIHGNMGQDSSKIRIKRSYTKRKDKIKYERKMSRYSHDSQNFENYANSVDGGKNYRKSYKGKRQANEMNNAQVIEKNFKKPYGVEVPRNAMEDSYQHNRMPIGYGYNGETNAYKYESDYAENNLDFNFNNNIPLQPADGYNSVDQSIVKLEKRNLSMNDIQIDSKFPLPPIDGSLNVSLAAARQTFNLPKNIGRIPKILPDLSNNRQRPPEPNADLKFRRPNHNNLMRQYNKEAVDKFKLDFGYSVKDENGKIHDDLSSLTPENDLDNEDEGLNAPKDGTGQKRIPICPPPEKIVKDTKYLFRCSACKKVYTHKSNYRRHYTVVHKRCEEAVFKCPMCEKRFTRSDNRTHHIKRIHGLTDILSVLSEEQAFYICPICKKAFTRNYNRTHHIKTVHKIMYPAIVLGNAS